MDRNRNAVSITSTVNSLFGAGLFSEKTGIVLNNEMDDFSIPSDTSSNDLPPAPANFVRPFKRPVSSMSPTIVLQVITAFFLLLQFLFSFLLGNGM